MIKNKTGFVGIGGYAGNQLLPFYKKNYPCLFINSAHQDLDSLKEVDESDKYHMVTYSWWRTYGELEKG